MVRSSKFAAGVSVYKCTSVRDAYTAGCLPPFNDFPFCDTALDISARVADLVQRLNDSEKA
jgi:hypothetical protein